MDLLALLSSHGTYMSDRDEDEIIANVARFQDPADYALRTCLCGARIDGFDAYHLHLVDVFREASSMVPRN